MKAGKSTRSGRKINPARALIFARYGGYANVCAWDQRAKKIGSSIPWADGPRAVRAWMIDHGKDAPDWLTEIIDREESAAGESADSAAPKFQWDGDSVRTLRESLAGMAQQLEEAKALKKDTGAIALLMKNFLKGSESYARISRAVRESDDGLVSLQVVLDTVDAIHAAIPDRIEAALLGSETEARAALDAGEWRSYCGRFRKHTMGELSERGFDVMLKTETKPKP